MGVMLTLAEQAAPAWLPFALLAIPVCLILGVGGTALRRRGRHSGARREQARRRQPQTTPLGSAAEIADPSGYSAEALLTALAVAPEDVGPRDGLPYNEGWAGTMLGLKARMSSSTTILEPHMFYGARNGRQVFVRIGPDEKIEGDSTMGTNRHVRDFVVVRVAAPRFDVAWEEGALQVGDESPPEVRGLVSSLAADRVTWSGTHVTGGPDGIVSWRRDIAGADYAWVYDLWLLERLADRLRSPALPAARLGPRWKIPYGLGARFKPKLSGLM